MSSYMEVVTNVRPGGRLLVNLVLMLEQKKTIRVLFSSWAVHSAVIVYGQKNGILVGKG